MLYLLTGGAGFLGINLVRFLLARGHTVRSLDIAPFDYPEKGAIDEVRGDIRDRTAVDRAISGVDMVVHCAAALPLYSRDEILSTNVEGTRIVLKSALEQGVPRVVHISSTAVYGIPDHHPIYEDDRLQGVGPYGESKIGAERMCLEVRANGLCVPVLRPKSFVGPERLGAFELLFDWASDGHNFPVLGSGNNRYQLLDVEDLCEAIYLCATLDREGVDDTFNVGAKDFSTMRQDFQAVLDHAGHGKRIVSLPEKPVVWALKGLETVHLSPLYRWVYETAGKESFVSVERIEQRFGFVPRFSNREALIRNFDWYRAHRSQFQGTSGISHRVPWKQGALRLAKQVF
ncbi:MAG: NAD-dependent epimerase/dehydratase [Geminicoccaceae bacterium]|jgi:nucleoside-diphosphate-sugar epimerase|nr:NAD-dependent epimerase/dehydratase [Geminicoccaceae bacterium]